MFKNNSVKIKITEQRFQFLLVLEFESELMCFQAQFIVDTSGIWLYSFTEKKGGN